MPEHESPDHQPAPPARTVLDEHKRWKIIALLANGSSRRMAARYVGCAASTITRTAARDPSFAEQVAQAEARTEMDALRAIRIAAQNKRHWRAAAWLLERRNPRRLRPTAGQRDHRRPIGTLIRPVYGDSV